MRSETLLNDAAAGRPAADRQTPAVGAALPRAKIPGPTTARSAGLAREPSADAVRAVRERDAADARGAVETAVLGAVASSMVLGALYPKDLKAHTAQDHPKPHDDDARDRGAAAQGAADPAVGGSDAGFGKAVHPPQAAETHFVFKGVPDFRGHEALPQVVQHAVEPSQVGLPAAIARDSHAAGSGGQEGHTQEVHAIGQALAGTPGASVQQDMVDRGVGPATESAVIGHGSTEQVDALAAIGRLPPAVGLTQFMAGLEPGGHGGGSIPAAAGAGAMPLDVLTAPGADAEAAVTSRVEAGAATAVPTLLGAVDPVVHSVLGEGLSHSLDTVALAAPLTQSITGTAAALTDAVAATAPAVETLTETVTGSLGHTLAGLASVTGTATALTDAAAPAVETLTETVTGSLGHTLAGLASVTGSASPDTGASGLHLVDSTASTVQAESSRLVEAVDRTVSHVDEGAQAALATTGSLLSGNADEGTHQSVTALVPAIIDHAVEATSVHDSNPVGAVAQVLDAPAHAESHAGQGPVSSVADAAGDAATPATTGALTQVSSTVDTLIHAGSGQHGTTADAAKDAAADTTGHSGLTTLAGGVGATVGSAVGGTINLGSSQAEPSQAHGASGAQATSAVGAPGDVGHTDAGGHAADVAHAAPDSVVAPLVHVGFAGLSYTENVDSHEHGLASANGMLHGLV